MHQDDAIQLSDREELVLESQVGLEELLREGAPKMLQAAVTNEVKEYVEACAELRGKTDSGRLCVMALIPNGP